MRKHDIYFGPASPFVLGIVFILALACALLALGAGLASADSLPRHQFDGWRDTGCDASKNVEIKNDKGDVLYLNNPTCNHGGGRQDDLNEAKARAADKPAAS
ncbi:hypothetical protein [Cereibacter changlensis]|uniref:hypothetical protein n=1 Tax=Cereibacter changlensis TaxID=402884 RepID=UPI004033860C